MIPGFAPEVIGGPLPDEGVNQTEVVQKDGRTYYQWWGAPGIALTCCMLSQDAIPPW